MVVLLLSLKAIFSGQPSNGQKKEKFTIALVDVISYYQLLPT